LNYEKGHGRIEEREIVVTNKLDWLDCKSKWKDLTSLIEVTSRRTIGDKTSEEKRFLHIKLKLNSRNEQVKSYESHWSIENQMDDWKNNNNNEFENSSNTHPVL